MMIFRHLNGTDTSNTRPDEPAWINQLAVKVRVWGSEGEKAVTAANECSTISGVSEAIGNALDELQQLRSLVADHALIQAAPNFDDPIWKSILSQDRAKRWTGWIGKAYIALEQIRETYPALDVVVNSTDSPVSWRAHCASMLEIENFGIWAAHGQEGSGIDDFHRRLKQMKNKHESAKASLKFLVRSIDLYRDNLQDVVKVFFQDQDATRHQLINIRKGILSLRTDSLDLDPISTPPSPRDTDSGLLSPYAAIDYLAELLRYCESREQVLADRESAATLATSLTPAQLKAGQQYQSAISARPSIANDLEAIHNWLLQTLGRDAVVEDVNTFKRYVRAYKNTL